MVRLALLPALLLLAPILLAQSGPPASPTPQMTVYEMSGGSVVSALNTGDPADFGRVFPPTVVGQHAQTVWLRITNSAYAGGHLNLSSPGVNQGAQAAQPEFELDLSRWQTPIPPGGYCELGVYFAPVYQYTGVRTNAVFFDYLPDPTGNPTGWTSWAVGLEGEGVTSEREWLSVRKGSAGGDRLFVNAASFYGAISLGSRVVSAGPGAAFEIHVVNEGAAGTADITLGTPARVSGSAEFSIDAAGFVATLSPGASTSFSVSFDPSQAAPSSAIVEFTHSDGYATNPFRLEFIGTGTSAPVQMFVTDEPGAWWVSGGSFAPFYTGQLIAENAAAAGKRDFGTPSSGSSMTVQIDNGDAGYVDINYQYWPGTDLTLGTPVISGDADFSLNLAGYSTTVASAGTTSFVVNFNPQADGVRSAVIEIPHGDASERTPFRVHVTGIGALSGGNPGGGTGGGAGPGGGGCVAAPSGSLAVLGLLGFVLRRRRSE